MSLFALEKILVPVDFSNFSEEALKAAVDIAKTQGGILTVLHVMEEPSPPPGYGQAWVIYRNWAKIKGEIEEKSRHVLEAMVQEAGDCRDVEKICAWGNPPHEIIQMAEDGNFDLIVMSTHGRTGLGRFMMGSVTERVIRHVSCPVLLIPAKE